MSVEIWTSFAFGWTRIVLQYALQEGKGPRFAQSLVTFGEQFVGCDSALWIMIRIEETCFPRIFHEKHVCRFPSRLIRFHYKTT